ncbi:DUF4132 domain-containing protein [Nocardiopsis sediminis]|uniref:DUF4132 domain-containing protein n=1 Tax=Nocardiopsis sediminis TaxID=1778267 RepID=A0ABV8FN57_9ACTN
MEAGCATAHTRPSDPPKGVTAMAAEEILRLERAMVARRRWSLAEFRVCFVEHPLLRTIARGLVWITDDGAAFRVAPDGTLVGADGAATTLGDEVGIGIAHPVELGNALDAWVEVFAAREILQPFPQLGRCVRALSGDERDRGELTVFRGHAVAAESLTGMEGRGWERDDPDGDGARCRLSWSLRGDRTVVVELDPAAPLAEGGTGSGWTVTRVGLDGAPAGEAGAAGALCFGSLDPVAASEVLADLTRLTAAD